MSDPNWPPPSQLNAAGGEPAGWGARFGAVVIDSVIVSVVLIALLFAAGAGADNATMGAGVVIAYIVAYLYAPLTMMRGGEHNGQTFGKQAVGIRVRRDSGAELGFWYSVLREILAKGLLGALTLGIDYLWPLWDRRNQALHDKVVRTFVVRAQRL